MPSILSIRSARTPAVTAETGRRHHQAHFAGMDALRGYTAVAVVLLHACVPYARPTMAGLSWSVSSETTSGLVTCLFWTLEVLVMPIFLVIAGFFTARSFASRGAWATTKVRAYRLGSPFLLAALFLLPVEFYIWMLGWVGEGHVSLSEVRRMKFTGDVDRNLWGFAHLWFLPYLISYIALQALAWTQICRLGKDQIRQFALPGCFFLAVLSLTLRPEIVWGFQHAFLPVPSKWTYSGAFFAAGGFWFLIDPQLSELASQARRLVGPAIFLLLAAVGTGIWWLAAAGDPTGWMAGAWGDSTPTIPSLDVTSSVSTAGLSVTHLPVTGTVVRLGVAALTVASASLMTFSLIGVCRSRVSPLSPLTQSLAKASFAIYLLHHPVVGLAHVSARFALPTVSPIAKVALVTGLGVGAGWSVSWLWYRYRQRVLISSIKPEEIIRLEIRGEEPRSLAFPRTQEVGMDKVA